MLVSEPKLIQVVQALRRKGFDVEEDYLDGDIDYHQEDDLVLDESRPSSPIDPTQFLLNINVLVNELQCVGLNRHNRSSWVHTVLKILCYSDLVESTQE